MNDTSRMDLQKELDAAIRDLSQLEKGPYVQTRGNGRFAMMAIARSALKQKIEGIKLRLTQLPN